MNITIFAAGSRGDIQPCVALGIGLKQAGYSIRLAVPDNFSSFIESHGLDFFPLHGDVQEIMASDTGRNFMEKGGGNPIKSIRTMRSLISPVVKRMVNDAYNACRNADAIICLGVMAGFGKSIAESLQLPLILVEPTPLLPTRTFAGASWPVQKNMGKALNYFSGVSMLRVVWQWYKPFINDFRNSLNLQNLTFRDFNLLFRSTPIIGAYSPEIIPHPTDWPDSVHITGYLFLNHELDWQPSAELTAFLDHGDPPVYIGFGSMSGRDPESLANLIFDALSQTGQRGLLATGWGGVRPENTPDNIFILDSPPHSWLFPRMSALIHHGGAGTTAEGLRSGVPMVIVPFSFDQPFWGERIRSLGLGPAPISLKRLTADRLAKAIQTVINDPAIKERARTMGEIIRAENGVRNAVDTIKNYLR